MAVAIKVTANAAEVVLKVPHLAVGCLDLLLRCWKTPLSNLVSEDG